MAHDRDPLQVYHRKSYTTRRVYCNVSVCDYQSVVLLFIFCSCVSGPRGHAGWCVFGGELFEYIKLEQEHQHRQETTATDART